jgi:glycosyltransferase involved in cell wall biosynthesis
MKVLIVNNMAPFIWGGAEELAANLEKQLVLAGHESEILRIPFQWNPARKIPSQMLLARSLNLWNVDHVIALKFPAYLIRHPRKTLWLVHQYRQAYDLLGTELSNIPASAEGDALVSLIKEADREAIRESRAVYTISPQVTVRLKKFNKLESMVLPLPLNDPELFCGGAPAGYILAAGRINRGKRQHQLVEAMRFAGKDVRLIVAGPPDSVEDGERLKKLVELHGLSGKVTLDLGFLPRQKYADYVNRADAVAYVPFDEDAPGYVTMEAAGAGKAVITAADSGGVLGLVKHGKTGWVCEPDAKALGHVLSEVAGAGRNTRELGANARSLWRSLDVTWPATIEALLR